MGEESKEVKYLVVIEWIKSSRPATFCVIKDTYEDAEAWITNTNEKNTLELEYKIITLEYEASMQDNINAAYKFVIYIQWYNDSIEPTYRIIKDTYTDAMSWIDEKEKNMEYAHVIPYKIHATTYEPSIKDNIKEDLMGEESKEVKYLIYIAWFLPGTPPTNCVLRDTYEEAEAWIAEEMKDKNPSGLGIHKITPIPYTSTKDNIKEA